MTLDYYYKDEQIGQFHFFRMPKILMKEISFKKLSSDAKLLYTLMLDRMCLSLKNGWIDNEDKVYIYYTINEIVEELGCSNTTCTKILCELDSKKGVGLIERKRQGQGKPDRIYVKNLVESTSESKEVVRDENETTKYDENCVELTANEKTMPISEIKKLPVQKHEIHVSKIKESNIQEMKKIRPNNNYINNNEWSNNELIYLSEKQEMDLIEEQKQLIRENIEYDFLLQYSNYGCKELVKELYQLICDVVCVPRKTIRIGGCNIFYEIAKSQFLKLNRSHLEYVMEQLKENTSKIINIKSYLLTALYNAPLTIHSYFRQRVQHDMYSGLIKNHCMLDGNKRIGVHTMLVFFALNGIELQYTQKELYEMVLSVADGSFEYEDMLHWVLEHQ